jgi:hypothetical protein
VLVDGMLGFLRSIEGLGEKKVDEEEAQEGRDAEEIKNIVPAEPLRHDAPDNGTDAWRYGWS